MEAKSIFDKGNKKAEIYEPSKCIPIGALLLRMYFSRNSKKVSLCRAESLNGKEIALQHHGWAHPHLMGGMEY